MQGNTLIRTKIVNVIKGVYISTFIYAHHSYFAYSAVALRFLITQRAWESAPRLWKKHDGCVVFSP